MKDKMTKEEALKKLNEYFDTIDKPINYRELNHIFLNKLEALGLIEFYEPKFSYDRNIVTAVAYSTSPDVETFLNNLATRGYKIVKDNIDK